MSKEFGAYSAAQRYHADQAEQLAQKILADSWARCEKAGLSPDGLCQSELSGLPLREMKAQSKSEYVFPHKVLQVQGKELGAFWGDPRIGYALFNRSGYLLNLYGAEPFLEFCRENKIYRGTLWSEAAMGSNAVGIGIREKVPLATIGPQNYASHLKQTAIYYAPFQLELVTDETPRFFRHGSDNGGVAILMPAQSAKREFFLSAIDFARFRSHQMYWFEFTKSYYENYDVGTMLLDITTENTYILSLGNNLRKLLHLTNSTTTYENLDQLVDPLPKNKEFWRLLKAGKRRDNQRMTLSALGQEHEVEIAMRVYTSDRLNITLCTLYVRSAQLIKELISKYTGNIARYSFSDMVGENPHFLNTLEQAKRAAKGSSSILLAGESGVGKDILAQAIHNSSQRRAGPFVALNCAAFSKELISSELFGYAEGSFTGAKRGGNMGKFELANRGTIFLDEIGDMPLELQTILLRVLEQKQFSKVGSNEILEADVRIIAATNINLFDKIKKGLFREDLYYRLATVRITLPPLRSRKEDILPLADHFIRQICTQAGLSPVHLDRDTQDFFLRYHWPGNVRELRNLLDGLIQTGDGKAIRLERVSEYLYFERTSEEEPASEAPPVPVSRGKREPLTAQSMLQALEATGNNRSLAAEYLGISRRTFYRKLAEFGLE